MASEQSKFASGEEIPALLPPPCPQTLQQRALACVEEWIQFSQGGCDGKNEASQDMIKWCLKITQSR
jgi:hypothetical protein